MKKLKIFLVKNKEDRFVLISNPQAGDTIIELTTIEVPKETDNFKMLSSMVKLVNKINKLNVDKVQIEVGINLSSEFEDKLTKPMIDIDVSTRLFNVLRGAQLNTLKDVISLGKRKFGNLRNVGETLRKEMEEVLALNGLSWETEV